MRRAEEQFRVLSGQRRFPSVRVFAPGDVVGAVCRLRRRKDGADVLDGASNLGPAVCRTGGKTVIFASSSEQARIEVRETEASLRCNEGDLRRDHELASELVLVNEPAQRQETRGKRMVTALKAAAGKQPHSRLVALGFC